MRQATAQMGFFVVVVVLLCCFKGRSRCGVKKLETLTVAQTSAQQDKQMA